LVGIDPEWRKVQKLLGSTMDALVDPEDHAAIDEALSASDLVVLSTPVRVVRAELRRALGFRATVTDCGSTKREIVRVAARFPGRDRFVPGHPMAGFPEGGVEHADPDLFVGRRWILCPEGANAAAQLQVQAMVRAVGAELVNMSAEAHDRAVALASHAPQVLASLLSATAAEVGADAVAGPGFMSATRVAGGSADIWQDIFESNADEVAWALQRVIAELEIVVAGLTGDPPDTRAVMALLARARQARRQR
jgi:prephenate dehydrogenase